MNYRGIIIILYAALFCIYFFSCANITQPTGGPKDSIPPSIIESYPQDQAIRFKGDELEITFSEIITVGNIKNEIIITPDIDKFDYKLVKEKLVLQFREELLPNTTYTFNLTGAVQDVTEKNKIETAIIAFSTGDYIDSLEISGMVSDLMTGKAKKGTLVGLYPINDTISVFKHKPQYFTRTDESGSFNLKNLKNTPFRLFAFVDVNNDRILQTTTESYGFEPEIINPSDSSQYYDIKRVTLNLDTLELRSARPFGPYFEIGFTKSYDTLNITSLDDSLPAYAVSDKDQKSVRLYSPFDSIAIADSVQIKLYAQDTIGFTIDTTLYASFKPSSRKPEKLSMRVDPTKGSKLEDNPSVKILFNKPMVSVNTDSISIFLDSLNSFTIPDSSLTWGKNRTDVTLHIPVSKASIKILNETNIENWVKAVKGDTIAAMSDTTGTLPQKPALISKFSIVVGDSAFYSIEKDFSRKATVDYSFAEASSTGIIRGTVEPGQYSYYKLQLMSGNQVIKELVNPLSYEFRDVKPATYQLRILIDTNGDGRWSMGNMLQNIPPDAIQKYPADIPVKPNWELDLENILLNTGGQTVDNGE